MPQAVLKITSYGRGLADAKKLTRYIGEQGETQVETDDGSILDTVEEMEQLAKAANRDEAVVASELRGALADVKARVEDVAGVYRGAVERARRRTVKRLREGRAR